jgi:hypothetical protein
MGEPCSELTGMLTALAKFIIKALLDADGPDLKKYKIKQNIIL